MLGYIIGVIWLFAGSSACSTKNVGEPYDEKTEIERARIALESGEYTTAIELYESAIATDSEAYQLYPLLSISYAANAKIVLSEVLKAQIKFKNSAKQEDTSGSSTAEGIDAQVQQVLPSNPSKDQLKSLSNAVDTLKKMPFEHRRDGAIYIYASGAAFQLSLFETMYSFMIIRQFVPTETETISIEEKLNALTDLEATAALQSLESAIANAPDTEAGRALRTVGAGKFEEIKNTPGATDKERLQNYLSGIPPGEVVPIPEEVTAPTVE